MTTNNLNTNKLTVIVMRDKFLEVMNALQIAVGSDSAGLPILKNVLIKVGDGRIVLTTTNLDLVIESVAAGKIVQDGEFTVPFSVLSNIIKNLSSDRITLEQKGLKLNVLTDNYEATINGHDSQDFPVIPEMKDVGATLGISGSFFREALSNVVVATQFSDIRPEISGVYIHEYDGSLFFVGTDSFRLAERSIICDKKQVETSGKISFIIPFKSVGDILRVLPDNDDVIEVKIDGHQMIIKGQTQKIVSRLIDGNFPDYRQIVPKDFAHEARLNRQEFLNSVKLVSSLSGKANDVMVKVGEGKKCLEVSSSDSVLGENICKVPAKIDGSIFSLVFNWRYVLDGLKTFKGEDVILGVNSSDKPVAIKDPSMPFLIYIVMPIKA